MLMILALCEKKMFEVRKKREIDFEILVTYVLYLNYLMFFTLNISPFTWWVLLWNFTVSRPT